MTSGLRVSILGGGALYSGLVEGLSASKIGYPWSSWCSWTSTRKKLTTVGTMVKYMLETEMPDVRVEKPVRAKPYRTWFILCQIAWA